VIDCRGLYAVPGLIDPHMHVDTTQLWPGELARVLVPLGTTTVFVDTVNIAHVGGTAAIQGLMDLFKGLPLRAYFSAPSYCPLDPALETAAAEITTTDIARLLGDPKVVSIGETVSSKILNLEADFLARLVLCAETGKLVSGHGGDLPKGVEAALDAYVSAGIRDDHCVNSVEDLLPRLRRGLTLFLVEAPGRRQLQGLLTHVKEQAIPTRNLCMCIDNITVMDIVAAGDGYLDKLVRIGLEVGLPPVDVVRMATLNPATHYNLADQIGNLAPGRLADILLLRDLDAFPPEIVIADGNVAARAGKLLGKIGKPDIPPVYQNSIHLPEPFSARHLTVWTDPTHAKEKVRVVRVVDGDAFNTCFAATLDVREGQVQASTQQDILAIAVVERHGRNGNITNSFVHGFGLQGGAIATSYSIPSDHLVTVGTNPQDMAIAVRHLADLQGGFVVVKDGQVLADVRLGIGGIMADDAYENVVAAIEKANQAVHSLGCRLQHPFFTMSQTVLSTLPEIGLTDRGILDVRTGQFVTAIIQEEADPEQVLQG
jgi:adenine deaminase